MDKLIKVRTRRMCAWAREWVGERVRQSDTESAFIMKVTATVPFRMQIPMNAPGMKISQSKQQEADRIKNPHWWINSRCLTRVWQAQTVPQVHNQISLSLHKTVVSLSLTKTEYFRRKTVHLSGSYSASLVSTWFFSLTDGWPMTSDNRTQNCNFPCCGL